LLWCTLSLNLNTSTVKITLYLFIIKDIIVICKLLSDGPFPLVQKGATIPVPEGLLYRISNRYKRFGTKAPPSLVPVPYEPVLKAPPRGLPGECRLGTFGTGL
jgi:hypothetical protein